MLWFQLSFFHFILYSWQKYQNGILFTLSIFQFYYSKIFIHICMFVMQQANTISPSRNVIHLQQCIGNAYLFHLSVNAFACILALLFHRFFVFIHHRSPYFAFIIRNALIAHLHFPIRNDRKYPPKNL